MYGDAAFPYQDRYGVGVIEVVFCDGAREIPVLMVVVDPALVGAWDNQETSVLLGHFVYRYSNGQEVVIGMGIEGPVLMPLNRRTTLLTPVSYTHLTLPTSDLVEISVVAVSL